MNSYIISLVNDIHNNKLNITKNKEKQNKKTTKNIILNIYLILKM